MTICHKLDDLQGPLTDHAQKSENNPYLVASNSSGDQNSRYPMLMAYPRKLIEQTANKNDDLPSIGINTYAAPNSTLQLVGNRFVFLAGKNTRALMATLSLSESTV